MISCDAAIHVSFDILKTLTSQIIYPAESVLFGVGWVSDRWKHSCNLIPYEVSISETPVSCIMLCIEWVKFSR